MDNKSAARSQEVFALKGHNKIAQGNALGGVTPNLFLRPEGAK